MRHTLPARTTEVVQSGGLAPGQFFRTNGSWYKELTSSGNIIWFKQYKTRSCKTCQARSQCTRSKTARLIHRSEFAEYYEVNRINFEEKEHLYKRRQAIVEHPYGTLKRQWGFSYILTKKGMERASSDVGFMFIAYNLRRIGNILTRDRLKEYLRILLSLLMTFSGLIRDNIEVYKRSGFLKWIIECKNYKMLNPA